MKRNELVRPEKSGLYRMRDGRTVRIAIRRVPERINDVYIDGIVEGEIHAGRWHESGIYAVNHYSANTPSNCSPQPFQSPGGPYDLIECIQKS